MFLTHFASVDCVNSDSGSEVTIQSCHRFLLRNHCRVQCIPMMFVLPSVVSEHSSRLIGDSTVMRVDAHSAIAQGKESRLLSSTRHVVSWSLVFLFSPCLDMFHRSWDSLVWQSDSPVYEPLVGATDTSEPGEVLCFVGLSGDQY